MVEQGQTSWTINAIREDVHPGAGIRTSKGLMNKRKRQGQARNILKKMLSVNGLNV
jgi:hypothetical protein